MHGHSAGGTNPSLVEAMFFGMPIIAYDVIYNRETTGNKAYYFCASDEIIRFLERSDLDGKAMTEIAEKNYTWKNIAANMSLYIGDFRFTDLHAG